MPETTTAPTNQHPIYRCAHCPRLLHTDELNRWACHVCEDRATEQVRALPDLYRQLEGALAPASAPSAGGRVTASRSAPLPAVLQPLSLRGPGGIVSMLLGIEQRWRIWLDWSLLPVRGGYEKSLAGTVTVIANNLPWACSDYSGVVDDLKLIASLHRQADAAVNGVRDLRVPIGCCPVVNEESGALCGQKMKASPWASAIRCAGCGTQWGRDEWLRLGAAMRGLVLSTAA